MEKPSNLKSFLESSLNEIFKATVSDILESVEQTLSEYQGKIQRIEAENEDLRRRLYESDIRIKMESKGNVNLYDERDCMWILLTLCVYSWVGCLYFPAEGYVL